MKPISSLYLFLIMSFILPCCVSSHPKETQSLIQTQLSSLTSITTSLPTLTATITQPTTLEPRQAEEVIGKLLKESIDCSAPCFWGVIPGLTNIDEAKEIFNNLGIRLEEIQTKSDLVFYYASYSFKNSLSIDLRLTVQEKMVMGIRAYFTPELIQPDISREWLAYSPDTLIKVNGNPSKIDFYINRGAPAVSYDMVMYFDKVNLIVDYSSFDVTYKEKFFRICPLIDRPYIVSIWLGKEPINPPLVGVPLEKASSITMEDFSKAITDTPDKACIFIKAELFP